MAILNSFNRVFLVRFFGYLFIQVGILVLILILEPVVVEEAKFRFNLLFGYHHILPQIITSTDTGLMTAADRLLPEAGFGGLLIGGSEIITPSSTDFGIVIEKINANAKVVPDVDPSNENSYTQALSVGVAHARGSSFPGQKGNIYLFSHSVDAPWNIVRFNAIFYLLVKLDEGDRVILFYKGRRFDYIVFDKVVVNPSDTHFLTDTYDQSVLTLQTCDPPGTLLNRLIIRAKLAGE